MPNRVAGAIMIGMSPLATVSVAVDGIGALVGAPTRSGTLTVLSRPTVTVVLAGDTLSPWSTAAVTVTAPDVPPNRRTDTAVGTVCPGATPIVRGAVSAIAPSAPTGASAACTQTLGRRLTRPSRPDERLSPCALASVLVTVTETSLLPACRTSVTSRRYGCHSTGSNAWPLTLTSATSRTSPRSRVQRCPASCAADRAIPCWYMALPEYVGWVAVHEPSGPDVDVEPSCIVQSPPRATGMSGSAT